MKKVPVFVASIGFLLLIVVSALAPRVLAQTEVSPTSPASITCEDGDLYFSQGRYDLARKAYEAVLQLYPQARCAIVGLASLPTETPTSTITLTPTETPTATSTPTATLVDSYLVAEKLSQIGAYDAAQTKVIEAIATNPADVRIATISQQPWWIANNMKNLSIPWGWVLALIIVALAIWWFIRQSKLQLDVSNFELAGVDLENLTSENLNSALISELEQSLLDLYKTCALTDPKRVIEQPLAPPELPSFTSIPSEVKDLWTFVTKIFPPNVVEIKGNLEFDSQKGPGLTFKLVHKRTNTIRSSQTVWMTDIRPNYQLSSQKPKLSDYLILAKPVAAYVYWHVSHGKRLTNKELRQAFGTNCVESYVAFIAANQCASEAESCTDEEALALYQQALSFDPDNRLAHYNFGCMSGSEDFQKHLERAKELSKPGKIGRRYDITYINASYNLGADAANKQDLTVAQAQLQDAFRSASLANKRNPRLFTEDYVMAIDIPLQAIIWWNNNQKTDPLEAKLKEKVYESPRVAYNLACYYTMAVVKGKLDEVRLGDALKYLEKALRGDRSYLQDAQGDPTLDLLRKKRKADFERLIKKWKPKSTKPFIKQLTLANLVGAENAKRLETAGIAKEQVYLEKANTKSKRKDLADKCAINEQKLLLWARGIELIRISGIAIQEVVLLDGAGISSLKQLAKFRHEELELLEKLDSAKKKLAQQIELPSRETLAWWIEQASQTKSLVKPTEK